uniref:GDP-fucose protein O-fucosyltransferase 2 n=1 Tax=Aplanochytrium stocchinoi TaxID=215587 RepID=A0A7S3LHZ6_9STRA|mmetsp:Transcript_27790/g.33987  ORF Transcript_27790/g.33987 Transcript_27790/m.33987 type:complete len:480 (+) Transcript_27790:45-1484(+)|eukprot:CAMPEP_0204867948 /NCGR_PEP_ID=MMETSP1348-20121228/24982_1 /ASSEMBLY_ACC=CAM_ASM_000700 /TAXON_ID=215587 /ORGANISM="Aplanochytrium stocchinoi, Strain GSBS06" /LENGTH=479 /DNA_ID=CAMNT_0052020673 /DNA_START=402 /DNA_END=1841 /DNA_ORIENTATION=-
MNKYATIKESRNWRLCQRPESFSAQVLLGLPLLLFVLTNTVFYLSGYGINAHSGALRSSFNFSKTFYSTSSISSLGFGKIRYDGEENGNVPDTDTLMAVDEDPYVSELSAEEQEKQLELQNGLSDLNASPNSGDFVPQRKATDKEVAVLAATPVTWDMVNEKYKLTEDSEGKFFVYQPSGGWGNQRIILQNAIAAANAMERILVLPPIAPHNFLWYGYNRFKAEEMVSMGELLDIPLLARVIKPGFRIYNGSLADLEKLWKHKKWKIYTKSRYKHNKNGKLTTERLFYSDKYISRNWGPKNYKDYDVVFWNKAGMWLCCGPSNIYGPNIGFNMHLRALAKTLHRPLFESFNAVHIRRGQGHTGRDRRTVDSYYKEHLLSFNKSLPLYIATDEKNLTWFEPLRMKYGFKQLHFWKDLDQVVISKELSVYPETMSGDVIGIIEQLICSKAVRFEGSHASTFSISINKFRDNPQLRNVLVTG